MPSDNPMTEEEIREWASTRTEAEIAKKIFRVGWDETNGIVSYRLAKVIVDTLNQVLTERKTASE